MAIAYLTYYRYESKLLGLYNISKDYIEFDLYNFLDISSKLVIWVVVIAGIIWFIYSFLDSLPNFELKYKWLFKGILYFILGISVYLLQASNYVIYFKAIEGIIGGKELTVGVFFIFIILLALAAEKYNIIKGSSSKAAIGLTVFASMFSLFLANPLQINNNNPDFYIFDKNGKGCVVIRKYNTKTICKENVEDPYSKVKILQVKDDTLKIKDFDNEELIAKLNNVRKSQSKPFLLKSIAINEYLDRRLLYTTYYKSKDNIEQCGPVLSKLFTLDNSLTVENSYQTYMEVKPIDTLNYIVDSRILENDKLYFGFGNDRQLMISTVEPDIIKQDSFNEQLDKFEQLGCRLHSEDDQYSQPTGIN